MHTDDAIREVKDLLSEELNRLQTLVSYKEKNRKHKEEYDPVQDMGVTHQIDDDRINLELIRKALVEVQQLEQTQINDKKQTSEIKR
ncbi:MAG: hypothetical protein ACD_44C00206G0010 [uncultured bacterium]|nr:MAG: hypothetical protein ACD_44C00206G0010 [uncultured bacterium]OGT15294.1 MAG: hypothetical protein A3B69_04230 [Gammaproteobacteria bacterium RIFCSPHIGHO2_02_FULL_38_33]OGT23974.1 MAG: hypothetical protein A2W47_01510 [Gammaproteobacteria bacterium RIFCSPHIGHO2_12_38_15]OGT68006.1 MAG: hypothetical protein A3I12_05515 [Gammaproteobacteria bacterium RIFCSPLOWO2_02_FULL_38_11]OGT76643.1 MAG: hypothetical protein A3G71_02550 [Gammaproteobacteria bacterium RIFCSPLOWO2_12_FULL_38_14]